MAKKTTKTQPRKKNVKKRPKKGCGCLKKAQKELAKKNLSLVTGFGIDHEQRRTFTTGPFLAVEKIEKSRDPLPTMFCTYCPFCGKKQ